jgi:DNA-binding MarR family transcriptional regulator
MISNLNKAFENRVRLGLMSLLMVNEQLDFNSIKEMLEITDGNLASHVTALEKAGYITIMKEFVGRKPQTSYKATATGIKAFQEHLAALEKLIRKIN